MKLNKVKHNKMWYVHIHLGYGSISLPYKLKLQLFYLGQCFLAYIGMNRIANFLSMAMVHSVETLEMQILRPHTRPLHKNFRGRTYSLHFNKSSRAFDGCRSLRNFHLFNSFDFFRVFWLVRIWVQFKTSQFWSLMIDYHLDQC